ncbi:uncharacterized protein DNG_00063 [Cephalotrichum gorgonifer]|uniref:Heterokaryon incompatibility domain-containing protein n=1 Tax=Cephalotrichum gorgonifer TaxID=2041049 RepID=A0AAE8SQE7_9PEZI|nr:uncharacterized protein DNG_00063 [Cephalotrichum gorgonifer]
MSALRVRTPCQDRLGSDDIFHLLVTDDDPAANFVPGRRESKDLSPKTVGIIQEWIQTSRAKDGMSDSPNLPRRVLRVGSSESDPVCLYEPESAERGEYAALSYCWGRGSQQITTTRANHAAHTAALPSSLPRTIADAVSVCRKIGLPYLWVDALCIIQDDTDDKLTQISRMGIIYKNATVTVLAACAAGVNEGFLATQTPEIDGDTEPLWLPIYRGPSEVPGRAFIRMQDGEDGRVYASEEPLFWRAWTFQELLLAPRALVFDSRQIVFKTAGGAFRSVAETHLDFQMECLDFPPAIHAAEGTPEAHDGSQCRIWSTVIHEYSGRDLTFFGDRLPALAGIVSELARVWDDVYVAGLWRRCLVRHLAWVRRFPWPERALFQELGGDGRVGAPSWSWATVPYAVQVMDLIQPDAQLVSYEVIPKFPEKAPLGEVSRASITLNAYVWSLPEVQATFDLKSPQSSMEGLPGVALDFSLPSPGLHIATSGTRRNGAAATVIPAIESMDMIRDLSSVPFELGCPISPFLDLDLGPDAGIPSHSLELNDGTNHNSAHPPLDEDDTLPSAAFIGGQPDAALATLSDSVIGNLDPCLVTTAGPNDFLQPASGPPASELGEWQSLGGSATHLYGADTPNAADVDGLSLVPVPSRTISTLDQSSGRRLSTGCRRFILSILRTYPRMMARPDNLPPFIHPRGCGLHFDSRDARGADSRASEPVAFAPLKPLAACHGIARIFASRGPNTSEFLWRTIESEHRLIVDEMHGYSRGEVLAAIQSIAVYTIMRVIESGRGYFIANRDLLKTMKKLGHRFGQLCPGPTSPPHKRHSRPYSWEQWMLEETRRRISIVCFIVALIVGSEGSPSIANPFRLPLPSGRALWEARSAWEWETEYDAWWGQSEGIADRLETVGDLSIAQLRRGGGDGWGMPGDFGGVGDDALDSWHAGVDGLGMLLTAVIADV